MLSFPGLILLDRYYTNTYVSLFLYRFARGNFAGAIRALITEMVHSYKIIIIHADRTKTLGDCGLLVSQLKRRSQAHACLWITPGTQAPAALSWMPSMDLITSPPAMTSVREYENSIFIPLCKYTRLSFSFCYRIAVFRCSC